MYKADIVAPNLVDQVWPQIADGVAKSYAKSGGGMTPGQLWQECRSGHAFLVVVYNPNALVGAIVVRFEYGPDKTRLRGLALVGTDLRAWIEPLRAKLTEMAKQGGAEVFIDEGRPGLVRLIPDAKIVRVTYEVEVK